MADFTSLAVLTARQNADQVAVARGAGTGRMTLAILIAGLLNQAQVDARAVARYTNTEKTKLAGVETSATADQTGAEIKALYEAEADTNALTNALLVMLQGAAPLAGPIFTGTPAAPTPPAATNSMRVATTAYVTAAIAAAALMGGGDGVLATAALQPDGVTLRLTLSNGSEIDVPLGALINGLVSGVTANEGLEGGGTMGDVTVGIADAGIAYAKLAAAAVTQIRTGLAALAGATFTGAVLGIAPTANEHLTRKDYVDTALAFRAALTGAVFTGEVSGVVPTAAAHFATKAYVDGLVNPPTPTSTSYAATGADGDFTAAEFMAGTSGQGNSLELNAWSGAQRAAFARPVTAGMITEVYFYAMGAGRGQNQIGAWTVQAAMLDIGGEAHYVVVSNNALTAITGITFVLEVA